jgi:hypothetical protein
MDYQKIYNNLISTRSNQPCLKDEYYEKHHIIPRCLGGTDEPTNLIMLTYREHYIAHWLLCKIHKKIPGIQYAFLCMLRRQPNGDRILTSRMFETIKRNYSEFKKWHIKIFNPGKTENSRVAARKRMTENNPISMDPSKNRTAQPIVVHFSDGRKESFSYAKQYCLKYGVPYATMKFWLKTGRGSKKHGITKIERV